MSPEVSGVGAGRGGRVNGHECRTRGLCPISSQGDPSLGARSGTPPPNPPAANWNKKRSVSSEGNHSLIKRPTLV